MKKMFPLILKAVLGLGFILLCLNFCLNDFPKVRMKADEFYRAREQSWNTACHAKGLKDPLWLVIPANVAKNRGYCGALGPDGHRSYQVTVLFCTDETGGLHATMPPPRVRDRPDYDFDPVGENCPQ